ncbi:MAG: tRNA 2-thiouridine(34) synthase MnmA [Clostridia bacterium]|nr:tRNA 2-thiouridine(34) synthase MnmA [Clostridia bacterium]
MKVALAMSGGVDSSVAAYLLNKEYDCIGCTMKLYEGEDTDGTAQKTCCSLSDVEDARSVACRIGIPYYVFNYKDGFKTNVIDRFVDSYLAGETPNPCIDCNKYMKFGLLYSRAKELGCDYIATGHYAIIEKSSDRYLLKKGLDETKDQSYVLYGMTQDELSHTLLPLGGLDKQTVRKIAEKNGFINARKKDSQDICFVPDGDYAAFIERYTGASFEPGDYTDTFGNILGRHKGHIHYTIGQRKGLGIALGKPRFVLDKDAKSNTVVLGDEEGLFYKNVLIKNANFIPFDTLSGDLRIYAKLRYRHKEQPATLHPVSESEAVIEFDSSQRAPAPGQSAVFYDRDIVVGGGIIVKGY